MPAPLVLFRRLDVPATRTVEISIISKAEARSYRRQQRAEQHAALVEQRLRQAREAQSLEQRAPALSRAAGDDVSEPRAAVSFIGVPESRSTFESVAASASGAVESKRGWTVGVAQPSSSPSAASAAAPAAAAGAPATALLRDPSQGTEPIVSGSPEAAGSSPSRPSIELAPLSLSPESEAGGSIPAAGEGALASSSQSASTHSSEPLTSRISDSEMLASAQAQAQAAAAAVTEQSPMFGLAGSPADVLLPAAAGVHLISDDSLLQLQRTLLAAAENERRMLMVFYTAQTQHMKQVMTLQKKQNLLRLRSDSYNPLRDPALARLYGSSSAARGVPMAVSEFAAHMTPEQGRQGAVAPPGVAPPGQHGDHGNSPVHGPK